MPKQWIATLIAGAIILAVGTPAGARNEAQQPLSAEDFDVTFERSADFDKRHLPARLQALEGQVVQLRG
jgi:hypothetical protein